MADAKYVVTGAVVVLPIKGGSERYLYRGAVITSGYTAAGIEHALAVGLIAEVPVIEEVEPVVVDAPVVEASKPTPVKPTGK
jgi:hypothetical protein